MNRNRRWCRRSPERASAFVVAPTLAALALTALALSGAGAGAAEPVPATPASEAADAALKARVLGALGRDDSARPLGLTAEVRGGVAVLRGRAPHLLARESAVHAAARVPGLVEVKDQIEIAPAPGGDAALRDALVEAVGREVRGARVEVAVKDGLATLSGNVQDTTQRAAARNAALRLLGLRGLDNQVRVAGEAEMDDARMHTRLVELIENRRLYPLQGDIRVRVVDRLVTLSGAVPRVFDRLIAEKVVSIVSGVRGVSNEIRVVPSPGSEVRQELPLPAR